MIILLVSSIIIHIYAFSNCVFCSEKRNASIIWNPNGKEFSIQDSIENEAVAWGYFTNAINKTGWSYLEVYTNEQYTDSFQAYAAGLVEGYLTSELITDYWNNIYANYCYAQDSFCTNLKQFLETNMNFMNEQLANNRSNPYWHQVALVLEQAQGLQDGYNNAPSLPDTHPEVMGVAFINLFGDLLDLQNSVKKNKVNKSSSANGHCSVLIKLLPNQEDLFIAHDTWDTYQTMLRILKKYVFPYKLSTEKDSEKIPGHTISFPSYPGAIFSGDDFYIISSELVSLETTIDNYNKSLYRYVQADKVILEWIRNIVANRLATTALEWASWFQLYNSGTYNNQWMIVDYKKFSPGNVSQEGLLVVLEQLPNIIVYADQTSFLLNNTYWASYNSPYYPLIFNMSETPKMVEKEGNSYSYDKCPRALIFKRDQGKVHNLKSMMKLMRYNDFKHDPLSRCNCSPPYDADNAIAARSDLNKRPSAFGAIDMKLTTYDLYKKYEFIAYSGPTYDQQSPFQWSKSAFPDIRHQGQPDLWKFKPIIHHWLNISEEIVSY